METYALYEPGRHGSKIQDFESFREAQLWHSQNMSNEMAEIRDGAGRLVAVFDAPQTSYDRTGKWRQTYGEGLKGLKNMKLTKVQLEQIIREEIEAVLLEAAGGGLSDTEMYAGAAIAANLRWDERLQNNATDQEEARAWEKAEDDVIEKGAYGKSFGSEKEVNDARLAWHKKKEAIVSKVALDNPFAASSSTAKGELESETKKALEQWEREATGNVLGWEQGDWSRRHKWVWLGQTRKGYATRMKALGKG
jgi:hypothetical protein